MPDECAGRSLHPQLAGDQPKGPMHPNRFVTAVAPRLARIGECSPWCVWLVLPCPSPASPSALHRRVSEERARSRLSASKWLPFSAQWCSRLRGFTGDGARRGRGRGARHLPIHVKRRHELRIPPRGSYGSSTRRLGIDCRAWFNILSAMSGSRTQSGSTSGSCCPTWSI